MYTNNNVVLVCAFSLLNSITSVIIILILDVLLSSTISFSCNLERCINSAITCSTYIPRIACNLAHVYDIYVHGKTKQCMYKFNMYNYYVLITYYTLQCWTFTFCKFSIIPFRIKFFVGTFMTFENSYWVTNVSCWLSSS